VIAHKQFLGATLAGIHTDVFCPPKVSGEWSFMAHALSHEVFEGRELFLKDIFSLLKMLISPVLESLNGRIDSKFAHFQSSGTQDNILFWHCTFFLIRLFFLGTS
jgi:hypothetical protein